MRMSTIGNFPLSLMTISVRYKHTPFVGLYDGIRRSLCGYCIAQRRERKSKKKKKKGMKNGGKTSCHVSFSTHDAVVHMKSPGDPGG